MDRSEKSEEEVNCPYLPSIRRDGGLCGKGGRVEV